MTVYVDSPIRTKRTATWRHESSCHMFADTREELVEFARSLGLKDEWIQGGILTHYDLSPNKRTQAIAAGARAVDRYEAVEIWRKQRAPT